MILYLDTSALVKLYVREAGSGEVKKLARESAALATSIVAYAEARAAFARLMREGVTVEKRHRERLKQFNADWESFMRIELGTCARAHRGRAGRGLRLARIRRHSPGERVVAERHLGRAITIYRPLTPGYGRRRNARACQWRHEQGAGAPREARGCNRGECRQPPTARCTDPPQSLGGGAVIPSEITEFFRSPWSR